MAFTLKAVANGEAEGYSIRDIPKLRNIAAEYDIPIEDRAPEEIANDLADLYIAQFGQQRGAVAPVSRASKKRQKLWDELGVTPRGVDREIVEALHRTHIGDDQDAEHADALETELEAPKQSLDSAAAVAVLDAGGELVVLEQLGQHVRLGRRDLQRADK